VGKKEGPARTRKTKGKQRAEERVRPKAGFSKRGQRYRKEEKEGRQENPHARKEDCERIFHFGAVSI